MTLRRFTLISMLTANLCYGQVAEDKSTVKQSLILTETQNKKWLDSLKAFPLKSQIVFIIQRIVSDTNVYIKAGYNDKIVVDERYQEKAKFEGCCKPRIIIQSGKEILYYSDKNTSEKVSTKTNQLIRILNLIKIDMVTVVYGSEASAIWGWNARYGAILLKVADKRSIALIKKQYKNTM